MITFFHLSGFVCLLLVNYIWKNTEIKYFSNKWHVDSFMSHQTLLINSVWFPWRRLADPSLQCYWIFTTIGGRTPVSLINGKHRIKIRKDPKRWKMLQNHVNALTNQRGWQRYSRWLLLDGVMFHSSSSACVWVSLRPAETLFPFSWSHTRA